MFLWGFVVVVLFFVFCSGRGMGGQCFFCTFPCMFVSCSYFWFALFNFIYFLCPLIIIMETCKALTRGSKS